MCLWPILWLFWFLNFTNATSFHLLQVSVNQLQVEKQYHLNRELLDWRNTSVHHLYEIMNKNRAAICFVLFKSSESKHCFVYCLSNNYCHLRRFLAWWTYCRLTSIFQDFTWKNYNFLRETNRNKNVFPWTVPCGCLWLRRIRSDYLL